MSGTRQLVDVLFLILSIGLLFPILVLIGNAARLSASRREERLAVFRLVGATSRQVNVLAVIDALVSTLVGVAIGTALFVVLKQQLIDHRAATLAFFATDFTLQVTGYAAIIIGVPLLSAVAGIWALRKVNISPLGVVRRISAKPPSFKRALPFFIGLAMFLSSTVAVSHYANTSLPSLFSLMLIFGFLLMIVGIVFAGPWITLMTARFIARHSSKSYTLLASRCLASYPTAAFRSVSGVILAVFVGTCLAGAAPALYSSHGPSEAPP